MDENVEKDVETLRTAIAAAAWANEYHNGREAADGQARVDNAALDRLLALVRDAKDAS